jgi:hypothetical protein
VYEPHENVEDDLEDLHDDVSCVVESAGPAEHQRQDQYHNDNQQQSSHVSSAPDFRRVYDNRHESGVRERLALAGPGRDTFAMTEEEIRERVKEILLKQALGESLTSKEETILAYAHYAAGEQAVRIWVRPDTGAAE